MLYINVALAKADWLMPTVVDDLAVCLSTLPLADKEKRFIRTLWPHSPPSTTVVDVWLKAGGNPRLRWANEADMRAEVNVPSLADRIAVAAQWAKDRASTAPAAAVQTDGPIDDRSVVERLEALADLREKGHLSDSEFDAAKRKVLGI